MRGRVGACLLTALVLVACTVGAASDPGPSGGAASAVTSGPGGQVPTGTVTPSPAQSGPAVALTVAASGPPGALNGLDRARVVVEYPLSDAGTGLVVVAGEEAGTIGPLRSATPSDAALAVAFGADLVTAQAAASVIDDLQQAGLRVVEEQAPPALVVRDAARRAPFNLYALTSQIIRRSPWAGRRPVRWPEGEGVLDAGRPITEMPVRAAPHLTVVWTWDARDSQWLRTYDGRLQQVADGSRAGAATVVLLEVESRGRLPVIGDVQGSGPALVLSGGQRHPARWERADAAALPTIAGADRVPLALGSDTTWIQVCAAPCT